MLEKRVFICWLQFAKVLNRVTGDCSLQPKTDQSQQTSPQEKICVDKCHQKNDLTFWPVNFRFHYGKNKMRVLLWIINLCPLVLSESTQLSLCQVGDLLKRTTTFHKLHTKSQRPHQNILSQHTPKFMYRIFCLWKQCRRMFFLRWNAMRMSLKVNIRSIASINSTEMCGMSL